jgi:hypothetical protein
MKNGKLWLIALVISLVTATVYLPALNHDFVNWDDLDYVYSNPQMGSPDLDFVKWSFSTLRLANWHPLMWISLSIDYAFWGLDPTGYHLTNIFLHAFNTLLVVLLTGLLFRTNSSLPMGGLLAASAVVGAFFGLHPLHVESVVWISERKDLLYALFWLLGLLAYMGYTLSRVVREKAFYYTLCLLLFTLSLLSKPMAVTFPVVLLILDVYPLKRLGPNKGFLNAAVFEKFPFLMLSLSISIVTIIAQKRAGAMEATSYLSIGERLWGAVKGLAFYLEKTIWPADLVPIYPLNVDISPMTWEYLGSLFLVLLLTVVSLKLRHRAPVLIVAWVYFFITLLPVIGIIQVGRQAVADRYMYLPILGPLMVLGALSSRLWTMGKKTSVFVALSFLATAGAMSYLSVKQMSLWQNSVSLWEYVIKKKPEFADAYYNLGNYYRDQRDLFKAEKEWKRTVEVEPRHSPALNQLGNLAFLSNSLVQAKAYYWAAVESDFDNAEAHYNLARVLETLDERGEALKHYGIFVNIAPPEYSHLIPKVREKLSVSRMNSRE